MSKTILGVKISSTDKGQVLEFVKNSLKTKYKFFIVTPNPEIVVQACKDSMFLQALNQADLAIPDGVGLKLAQPDLKIVKGRELMLDLFVLANEQKLKLYLLGSDKKTIDKSLEILSKFYSYVVVRGVSGPRLNKTAQPVTKKDIGLEKEALKAILQDRSKTIKLHLP